MTHLKQKRTKFDFLTFNSSHTYLLLSLKKSINSIFLICLALASSVATAEQRERIEIATNTKCKYVEYPLIERAEERRKSSVTWDGKCEKGLLSGYGTTVLKASDGTVTTISTTYRGGLEEGTGISRTEGPQGVAVFTGSWSNGSRASGVLDIKLANGTSYVYNGGFADGKFQGNGNIKYANGIWYEGMFRAGKFDGQGRIIFTNGDIYSGEFREGNRTGSGTYTWVNGTTYEGAFLNNRIEGYGVKKYPNGDTMSGMTKNDKMESTWIIKKPNGDSYIAEYSNGQQISVNANPANQSQSAQRSYDSDYAQAKQRQKGIDSLNCEAYAKNSTSNQQAAPPPGPAGLASLASIFAQTALIGMNTQEYYDSCMKRLGY